VDRQRRDPRDQCSGHGFEWNYTLNIVVEDFAADPSMMFLVICEWARRNQPDLLQPGKAAFRLNRT
jgi:hypothetical protein